VGSLAVPGNAKQDPSASTGWTPPGQAKKQDAAQQQAAPTRQQAAPTAAATTTTAPTTHTPPGQAKKQAGRQATTSTVTTSTRQPSTSTQTKNNGNGASAQAQSPTSSLPPGQAKKLPPTPTPAPAPAPAPSSPVSTKGTIKKAKPRHHKAAAHHTARRTTATRPAAVSRPIARISPAGTTTIAKRANKTKAHKTTGGGFVPNPKPAKQDDAAPSVVFRTVRDAVEVVPTTIWVLLGLLTALASLFAVTSARQTRRARRLALERGELIGDVGVLQDAVLPVVPPRVGALALSVAHRPAGGPAAGGDIYDVIPLDHGRTALVVGDVTGHGAGALSQATLVRFTLRAHLETGAGPREALAIATESLAPHFDEGFATAAVAIHDPAEGTLTYATAAHEAPIVVGPGEHLPVLASSTPPLGIGAGPSARRQTTGPFPAGSLACMLTDGALEARVRGELVGRARVEEWVRELGERPAAGDMAELIRARAAVSDDLAVCFATATAGDESGNWRIEELHRPTPEEAERFLEACGATDEQKHKATEALRFNREGTTLTVRLQDGAVVAADVQRNGDPTPVAA
jgi:hypothetical protein